jgi:hypothetical protein
MARCHRKLGLATPCVGGLDFVIFIGLSVCLEELELHPTITDSARELIPGNAAARVGGGGGIGAPADKANRAFPCRFRGSEASTFRVYNYTLCRQQAEVI